MATNNFKKLAEESEKQYPHAPPEIEQELMGSMRMTHFVGNVVDLYLPRFFGMILSLFGASNEPYQTANTPENKNEETKTHRDSGDVAEGYSKSDD